MERAVAFILIFTLSACGAGSKPESSTPAAVPQNSSEKSPPDKTQGLSTGSTDKTDKTLKPARPAFEALPPACDDPEEDRHHTGPGLLTQGMEGSKDSLSDINEAIKSNPNSVDLLLKRGEAELLGGDMEGARDDFLKAKQIDPKNYIAHIGMARFYEFQEKRDKAVDELKVAAKLAPPEFADDAIFESAFLNRESCHYPAALVQYNQIVDSRYMSKKRKGYLHFQRAELYLRMQKRDLAREDLLLAIKLDPTRTQFQLMLANMHKDEGILDQALAEYTHIIKYEKETRGADFIGGPGSAINKAYLSRSDIYVKMGRPDLAKADRAAERNNEKEMLEAVPFESK